MQVVVLLLVCSLASMEAGLSTNSLYNLMFRPAGRSRSFKWAGMGKAYTPSYIPPRPVYIPKWVPGAKPEYIARWVPNTPPPLQAFRSSLKLTDANYGFGAPKQNSVVKGSTPLGAFDAAFRDYGSPKSDVVTAASPLFVNPLQIQEAFSKIRAATKNRGIIQIPNGENSITLGSSIRTPSQNNVRGERKNDFSDAIVEGTNNYYTSVKTAASFIGEPSNYNPQDSIASASMFAGPLHNSIFIDANNHQLDGFSAPRQQDILIQPVPQALKSSVLSAPLSQYSVIDIPQNELSDQEESRSEQHDTIAHPEDQIDMQEHEEEEIEEVYENNHDYSESYDSQLLISDEDEDYNEIENDNFDEQTVYHEQEYDNNVDVLEEENELYNNEHDNYQYGEYNDENTSYDYDNEYSDNDSFYGEQEAEIVDGKPIQDDSHSYDTFPESPSYEIDTENYNSETYNPNDYREIVVGSSFQSNVKPQENLQLEEYDTQSDVQNYDVNYDNNYENQENEEEIVYIIDPKKRQEDSETHLPQYPLSTDSRNQEADGVASITVVNPHAVAPPRLPVVRSYSEHRSFPSIRRTIEDMSSFERRTNRPKGRRLFSPQASLFRPSYRKLIERSRQAAPRSLWWF